MRSYQRPSALDDLPAAMRASVSFPAALYHALEEIARQKHMSLAWVVRDAAERYVAGAQKRRTARRRLERQGRENSR